MHSDMDRFFMFSLFERRAANKVYQTFRVNRFELWLLFAMVAVLGLHGKKSTSKRQIFDTVTGHTVAKRKMEGFWSGLVSKGLVMSVTLKNRLEGWVLTPLAVKCIGTFEVEIKRLEAAEKARQIKVQTYKDVIKPYPLNELGITTIEDLSSHYKSVNAK